MILKFYTQWISKKSTTFLFLFFLLLPFSLVFAQSSHQVVRLDENGAMQHEFLMESETEVIQICGLIKGKTYTAFLFEENRNTACKYKLLLNGQVISAFTAIDNCQEFVALREDCQNDSFSNYTKLLVNCRNCVLDSRTRITYLETRDAVDLVTNVLLANSCFEVIESSIKFRGSIGRFDGGETSIGMKNGIVIANASLSEFNGGNSTTGAGGEGPDLAIREGDLTLLSGVVQSDPGLIEFDFIPAADFMEFDYVFASEEYCDYVDVQYNDAFGFFLSGPGINDTFINGATNIALLPDPHDPLQPPFVSINSVNYYDNSQYYHDNNIARNYGGTCQPIETMNPFAPTDTQFDGFTTVLKARYDGLQQCETYHVKMVVADGADKIFGSAVFMGGNSFTAGGGIDIAVEFDQTGSNYLYENCGNNHGVVKFIRNDIDPDNIDWINIGVTTTGTATRNRDYSLTFNRSIDIPPVKNPGLWFEEINVIPDTIFEGIEDVQLELDVPCSCDKPFYEFFIIDVDSLILEPMEDRAMCSPTPWTLNPVVEGGIPEAAIRGVAYGIDILTPLPEYTFSWTGPNGFTANTKRIDFTPPADPGAYEYYFSVSDDCGNAAYDTVVIKVIGTPTALLSGVGLLCDEVTDAELPIDFGGVGPWDLVYSLNGVDQPAIVVNSTPYMLPVTELGDYALVSVESNTCPGDVDGAGVVNPVVLNPLASSQPTLCFDGDDGTATATISGGKAPYSYEWSNSSTDQTATGLSPGMASVTITDSLGCKTMTSTMVDQPPLLVASAVEVNGTTCAEPNIGKADLTALGGALPYFYNWSNGGGTAEDPNTLSAGDYVITVTDNNGCSVETNVTISADENTPKAIADAPFKITCKDQTVKITGTGSSTGIDFTYDWTASNGGVITSGQNSLEPTVGSIGTYQILVTNTDNGCTNKAEIIVEDDIVKPTISTDDPEILTCKKLSVDLFGEGTSLGTFSYKWLDGATEISNTNNGVATDIGTYTLVVTNNENGCSDQKNVVVTENTTLPTVVANSPDILTCEDKTIEINNNGSDAGPNFTYSWSASDGGVIDMNATSGSPTVSATGTYTVTVTNTETGCVESASVEVNENVDDPVILVVDPEILTCQKEEIPIDATQSSSGTDFIYEWTATTGNILSGGNSLTPIVNEKGSYHLMIKNKSNGCTSEDDVEVDQMADFPNVEILDPIELNCETLEISLDGTNSLNVGNFSTIWSTVDGNIVSTDIPLEAVVDQPGTYELLIENLDTGCKKRKTVEVTQDIVEPEVDAGLTQTLSCAIENLDLAGQVISASNSYDLIWTTDVGHIVSGATSISPKIDQPGIYTVVITNDDNHCKAESSVEIKKDENAPDAAIVDPAVLTCILQQIQLNGAGSSEGSDIKYKWSTSTGNIIAGGNTIEPYIGSPGTYILTVKDDSNGCETSTSIVVTENVKDPLANAGDNDEITCAKPETTLNGVDTAVGNSYKWTTKYGNIISGAATLNPVVDQIGFYTLLITNDENGCFDLDSTEVTSNEVYPDVSIVDPAILSCVIKECPIKSNTSNGNNLSFDWNTTTGNILSGKTTSEINVDSPGSYEIVVVDGDTGCKTTKSIEVFEDTEKPDVDAGPTGELTCTITEIPLNGSGSTGSNFTYLWSTDDGEISGGTNSLKSVAAKFGTYKLLIVNNTNGCEESDEVTITVSDDVPTALNLDPIPPLCFGDAGRVGVLSVDGGVPPFTYSLDGQNFTKNPGFDNLEPGDYIVYLLDSNGCKLDAKLNIPFVPKVTVDLVDTIEISLGDNFELIPVTNIPDEEIETVIWSPERGLSCTDCLNPTTSSEYDIVYSVTIINKNGCSEMASVALRVDREVKIYFPTGFSPNNGDGVNDFFYPIVEKGVKSIKSLNIYDRWGNKLFVNTDFQPNDSSEGWDGRYRDEKMNAGVFGWFAEVELFDGSIKIFKGDVTILN